MSSKVVFQISLASIAFVMCTQANCQKNNRFTKQMVENLIVKEIAPNSDKNRILEFLNKRKIKHSDYQPLLGNEEPRFNSDLQTPELKGNAHRIKYFIFATVPGKSFSVWKTDIYITFYFDEKSSLIGYVIRENKDSF